MSAADEKIAELQQATVAADEALRAAVLEACPGEHHPVQHRDRRPPWCKACGRTARGVLAKAPEPGDSLTAMLHAQREWSTETFGPGSRLAGVLAHIRKELKEVEAAPEDVEEWIDVVILAFDGAWRAGHDPEAIVTALLAKYAKNRARDWPDWRTADPDAPIEHVR